MHRRLCFASLGLALCCLLLPACKNTKISSYRVPKDADAPDTPPGLDAAAPAAAAGVHWTTPAGWQELPASGMREGSFRVPGANGQDGDMSVISFPGDGGGDLANVNRWRGQLQLAPIAEADLPGALQTLAAPAGRFQLVDLTSDAPLIDGKFKSRMLAAFLQRPDRIWFFKLTGAADLVGAQRAAFTAFLKSVSFPAVLAGNPSAGVQNTNDLPSDVPAMPGVAPVASGAAGPAMNSVPVDTAQGPSLTWRAPASWQVKPADAMRKGSYAIGDGSGATADLSITAFPGDVGGTLANVNRWRGQAGLAPVTDAELASVTTALTAHGLSFTVVDCAGVNGPRILGAILPWQGNTWFFKLTGPDALVAHAKPDFLAFLKTVQAP